VLGWFGPRDFSSPSSARTPVRVSTALYFAYTDQRPEWQPDSVGCRLRKTTKLPALTRISWPFTPGVPPRTPRQFAPKLSGRKHRLCLGFLRTEKFHYSASPPVSTLPLRGWAETCDRTDSRCEPRSTMRRPKLFASYRRDDSFGLAGRLYDRLLTQFGQDSVFMDVDSIRPRMV
jgi:hypothetical protein